MTNKERKAMKKAHEREQQQNGEAMARAQRNGALGRIGQPLNVQEPSFSSNEIETSITVPGCATAVKLEGYEATYGEFTKVFYSQDRRESKKQMHAWFAGQRQTWMRVHRANDLRLLVRSRVEGFIKQILAIAEEQRDLIGPDCAEFLGEAMLQLGFAAAQIEDDGTLSGDEEKVEEVDCG